MSTTDWVDALSTAELPTDDVIGVVVAGRDIAVYTVGDAVYATDNVCTHGAGSLCEGWLEGFEIECPLHQGRFDVRDGRPLCTPATEAIRVYPAKVEAGRVLLDLG